MNGDGAPIHVHSPERGDDRSRSAGRARTVVVGVAGEPGSGSALDWAARYAASRGLEVEIVHSIGMPTSGLEAVYYDGVLKEGERLLRSHASALRSRMPELPVRAVLDYATPSRSLTDRSEDAALVVVGAHRRSRVERAFSGSLSYQVAAGAHCPVVVVPRGEGIAPAGERAGGVVVGIDGSKDARAALQRAADEAVALDEILHVMHAWQRSGAPNGPVPEASQTPGSVEEGHGHLLAEAVAGLARTHPGLSVRKQLVLEQPAHALVEASRKARLVVVGSRGLHGVARMLLGSVSHTTVIHAVGPVMVVRSGG